MLKRKQTNILRGFIIINKNFLSDATKRERKQRGIKESYCLTKRSLSFLHLTAEKCPVKSGTWLSATQLVQKWRIKLSLKVLFSWVILQPTWFFKNSLFIPIALKLNESQPSSPLSIIVCHHGFMNAWWYYKDAYDGQMKKCCSFCRGRSKNTIATQ